jgi:2-phospho-L-lactate guanylyltransferase
VSSVTPLSGVSPRKGKNRTVPSPPWNGARRWSVVLPLKGGPAAKSRLGAPPAVATAIALDCLDAVRRARSVVSVVVVTPDPALRSYAAAAGAVVRSESAPGGGLLAAVSDGLAGLSGPVAVLLGDLPALLPEDLDAALHLASTALTMMRDVETRRPPESVFVPDAEGTGTVLLAALTPAAMRPQFGPASAALHEQAGARRLEAALPRLRRDVDTPDDLRAAAALGVGPRTRELLSLVPDLP